MYEQYTSVQMLCGTQFNLGQTVKERINCIFVQTWLACQVESNTYRMETEESRKM